MATIVLGGVGAALGSLAGETQLGFSVGVMAAGLLFPPNRKDQSGHPLADLRIHGSGYGSTIPQVYGRFRISGNVIDATELVRHRRHGGTKSAGAQSNSFYSCSLAIAVTRGPITSIDKIWAHDLLVYDASKTPPTQLTLRTYLGDELQTPDSLFQSLHGANQTPAYRGLAYVVFENLDLSPWGNTPPSFNFEITNVVPYHAIIENSGPLLYYRFSTALGTLIDSGSKHDNLTVIGSLTTTINGHADQAPIIPPGSALRATTGNDPDLEPARFSVEGWFQYKGDPVVNGGSHFAYRNPNTGEIAWQLWVNPNAFTATVNLSFRVFTTLSGVVDVFSFSVARDPNNIWHHLVVTYDTTGQAILYYDSVQQAATVAPVAPVTITADAANNINIDNGDYRWDELAFYNRILTPLEIVNHYQGRGSTTGTILADVFNQAGLSPSQYDVSQATDYVEGFLIHTRQAARSQITELLRLYDTDLIERDGKLVALKRGQPSSATIPTADLGAHVTTGPETEPPVKVTVKRLPELEIPQRLDLRYYDRATNYEMGLQGASRYTKAGEVQDALTIQTTLVLHQDDARQKAEKELYRQWTEREQHGISLGPAYLAVCAGDVLTLPIGATSRRVRVIAMDLGLLGPLQVSAVLDDASLLTQNAVGTPLLPALDIVLATAVSLQAFSCNALYDSDATQVGFYAACGIPSGSGWAGAGLYLSLDSGASYQFLDNVGSPADIGTALTVLSPNSPGNVWDTVNTVDVTMTNGDPPLSTSDGDVLAGSNAALLGTEVIQYATVTPLGGSNYRLSRLLRGRRGTEPHEGEHQIGEPFILLSHQTVTHFPLSQSVAGKGIWLKAVTVGGQLATTTAVPLLVSGDELKPYSVVQLKATRNVGLDVLYTWVPRARFGGGLHDGADIAVTDPGMIESYTVCILNGNFNSITAISSDPVAGVVTCPFHGFSNGNVISMSGLQGITPLNGRLVTISNVTTSTFTMLNTPTAAMPPYLSGGTAEPVIRQIAAFAPSATYTVAAQTADFGSAQSSVRTLVYQNGFYGMGYSSGLTIV